MKAMIKIIRSDEKKILIFNWNFFKVKMETEELFLDEDMEQIETMRTARKKLKDKDFAKLINKRDLSGFEMDEIFVE